MASQSPKKKNGIRPKGQRTTATKKTTKRASNAKTRRAKPPVTRKKGTTGKSGRGRNGGRGGGGGRTGMNRFAVWLLTLGIWVGVIGVVMMAYYAHDLPDIDNIDTISKRPSVVILAKDETILANYGDLYGEYMGYEDFPPALIQALLATEDRRFFHHFGVDPMGLMRAMFRNVEAGRVVQGGSTITQQLAKNLFLSPERTLKRKVQEVMLAVWLEYRFSKEEILTLYLNRVYLGAGTYGVDAAALRYFHKSARNLNLSESALIVGLLKAPSRYSPSNDPELARSRAHQVLKNMEDAGFITDETVELARQFPSQQEGYKDGSRGSYYFADWVLEQLPNFLGRIDQDIEVVTTIDARLQTAAEDAVTGFLAKEGSAKKVEQGALLSMAPDGAILAMVGGKDYRESQYNRATQAMRQPGSAFKLFPYLTAIERGASPQDIWLDQPFTAEGWSPDNYNQRYMGAISLEQALAGSVNTVAAQVNEYVGRRNTVRTARRLGVESDMLAIPSMALGTNEMTLKELTTAYTHLASGGRRVQPFGIVAIRTIPGSDASAEGMRGKRQQLYKRLSSARDPVIDPRSVRMMHRMLSSVMTSGTGRAAAVPGHPAAGKTGTSQNYRDAWFVGYTPDITTGVWVGNDDNTPMAGVTGGSLPARIWKRYTQAALQGVTPKALETTFEGEENTLPWQQKSPSFWDFFYVTEPQGEPQEGRRAPAQQQAPIEYHHNDQPAQAPRGGAPQRQEPRHMPPVHGNDDSTMDTLGDFIDDLGTEVEYDYPKPSRN